MQNTFGDNLGQDRLDEESTDKNLHQNNLSIDALVISEYSEKLNMKDNII